MLNVGFLIVFLGCLVSLSMEDEHGHEYSVEEEVVLWMNTVGPYQNQQERYSFFSLPFCRGPLEDVSHYHETLGEALLGTELEFSGLEIRFRIPVANKEFCVLTSLKKSELKAFVYAVKNQYSYQMYLDDLPIVGIVGDVDDDNYYLWTHKKIEIGYNGNQIIDVNFTSENPVKLEKNIRLSFTYEVKWKKSPVLFKNRFDRYLDPGFFQHRIHWFSIFNSFMMVIFLVGLVVLILMRTLRKDYARYSKDDEIDEMERDLGDEYGWKQVHGDVFRPVAPFLLFTALIGTGCQLFFVVLFVILSATFSDLYLERGSLLSTIIFIYSTTSPINGFFGGSLYIRMGGKNWIRQMITSSLILPTCICTMAFFINMVSIYYQTSRAIPFATMLAILCIIIFIILPLTFVGTIVGRNLVGIPDFPCRINAVPRPIPEKKWYMEPVIIIFMGGILPFGSIFIEMYFVLTSFWAYKYYYVYGFMLLVFLILIVVTICVTIVCSYFLLNAEDYRWQWTSFSVGASTSGYLYLYSVYFFFFKTS
ncbi:transmembrane 9 superfamily member 3 isoform X3 [Lepeophtheirus salmonis]|nr:transmembrane 9 superfamily member 3-like isoform X3 [Lepeophtheirus salmonis]